MARNKKEIEQIIKASFTSNATLIEDYGLNESKTFDEQFSKVSIEAIIISIVASSIWLLEQLWDAFSARVEDRINNAYVMSLSWYYRKALAFQKGCALTFDAKTYSFGYPVVDETKQIVKYAAIREVLIDNVPKLKIYFSDANKAAIIGEDKVNFETYMRLVGAAGTHYEFISQSPDSIGINLRIWYDPLVLYSTGTRISGGGKPVEETIASYLNSLEYGGAFYASKLVDMLQQTEGVKDVVLDTLTWGGMTEYVRKIYSASGSFSLDSKISNIIYNIE